MTTHIFLLQVEQVVDGVVDSVGKARHCNFVRLVGAWLRESDIHLNKRLKSREREHNIESELRIQRII